MKKLFCLALALLLLTLSLSALAEGKWTRSGDRRSEYVVLSDGSLSLKKHLYPDSEELVIPSRIDKKRVTEVSGLVIFIPLNGVTAVRSVTIPNSVRVIRENPFALLTEAAEFRVKGTHPVFEVEDGALYDKQKQKLLAYPAAREGESLVIREGTVEIGEGAFTGCRYLTSVTFPDSLAGLSASPFTGCTALTDFVVSADHPALKVEDGMLFSQDGSTLLAYPLGDTRAACTVPEGTRKIGARAFASCENLMTVTVPEGVTEIGDEAFDLCLSLKAIYLPKSLTEMPSGAMYGCSPDLKVYVVRGSWAEKFCKQEKLKVGYQ
ncbi:MAG: leucine-rich repeat domain-containing protein [Clostridia bacterium]|nr:leucine-rich repeat domain-containing protein [Clostridia bacterium]